MLLAGSIDEDMVAYYRLGNSTGKTGRKFGISQKSCYNLLKNMGEPIRGRSGCNKLPVNEFAFSELTPESEYWIGYLMADGCLYADKRSGSRMLSLTCKDREHVDKFKTFLGSYHKIGTKKPTRGVYGGVCYTLTLTSSRICDDLKNYGVTQEKTKNAECIGLQDSRHFWRGMVDGDGWVCRGRILGLTGTRCICGQFIRFVDRHFPTKATVCRNNSIWKCAFTKKKAHNIGKLLYEDCVVFLDRKKDIVQSWNAA